MSKIYFHSPDGESEVSVRERASFAGICHDLLMAAIGPIFDRADKPHWTRRMFPADHYLKSPGVIRPEHYAQSLSTSLQASHVKLLLPEPASGFELGLNTAMAIGGDALQLVAHIHGQCEIHAWAYGEDRKWLAQIIREGRKSGLYRADMGWESVIEHLESGSESVVMSYSVCESFPNPYVAGWRDTHPEDEGCDDWADLPDEKKWELAFDAISKEEGLQMTPDRWEWPDFYFSPKVTGFDLHGLVSSMEMADAR